jgi:hypothetical protein
MVIFHSYVSLPEGSWNISTVGSEKPLGPGGTFVQVRGAQDVDARIDGAVQPTHQLLSGNSSHSELQHHPGNTR